MKIDGRGHPYGEGYHKGTDAEAEGPDNAGENAALGHSLKGWLR